MVGEKQAICESAVAYVGLDSDLYSYDPFVNDSRCSSGLDTWEQTVLEIRIRMVNPLGRMELSSRKQRLSSTAFR